MAFGIYGDYTAKIYIPVNLDVQVISTSTFFF